MTIMSELWQFTFHTPAVTIMQIMAKSKVTGRTRDKSVCDASVALNKQNPVGWKAPGAVPAELVNGENYQ